MARDRSIVITVVAMYKKVTANGVSFASVGSSATVHRGRAERPERGADVVPKTG